MLTATYMRPRCESRVLLIVNHVKELEPAGNKSSDEGQKDAPDVAAAAATGTKFSQNSGTNQQVSTLQPAASTAPAPEAEGGTAGPVAEAVQAAAVRRSARQTAGGGTQRWLDDAQVSTCLILLIVGSVDGSLPIRACASFKEGQPPSYDQNSFPASLEV